MKRAGAYRIGVVVDDVRVHRWIADFCAWAEADPGVALAALLVAPRAPARPALDRLLRLETRLLRRTAEVRPFIERHSIADCAAVEIALAPRLHGEPLLLSDTARSVLEGLGLDALVDCRRGLPDRDLARFARDGLLFVTAGGNDGAAEGLAELVEGKIDTPFVIEQALGDGRRLTLFGGSVATSLFFAANFHAVHARAFGYLREVLGRLASGAIGTASELVGPCGLQSHESTAPAEVRSGPGLVSYALRTLWRSAGKATRRLLRKEFNWQVGFARQAWWACDRARARLIPNPPGAFLADPFAIRHDGRDYLFVEEFPFDTRKGVISAYALVGDRAERIGKVLEEPYHLSFPFVFEHDGEMFMVPESGADRSIRLYRSSAFPGGWSLAKILISDVAAVDNMLFRHEGRWWLLTTIQGDGPALNNAELHAFYADDLFGEWTAHKANPIVLDAKKGRNGGLLRDSDGSLCRVAQVPGLTFYGQQAAIYRIEELTPDSYRERAVRKLEPDFLPGLAGTHHMSGTSRLTVFDYMRVERPRKPSPRATRRSSAQAALATDGRLGVATAVEGE